MSLNVVAIRRSSGRVEVVAEVDMGPYGLLHSIKSTVGHLLEGDKWGSRFPLLMNRSDTDAKYSQTEVGALAIELEQIEQELSQFAPSQVVWARDPAFAEPLPHMVDPQARNLAEYFLTVDEKKALEELKRLCRLASEQNLEIDFC